MEETYRGGTISANGKRAVITFREGWDTPGDWDIDFYVEDALFETVTIRQEDTTPNDVITSALAFVGYDETAMENDMASLLLSRKKIQEEANRLSVLCSQDTSFESVIEQLRQVSNMVDTAAYQHLSIYRHIAVYKAVRNVDKRL